MNNHVTPHSIRNKTLLELSMSSQIASSFLSAICTSCVTILNFMLIIALFLFRILPYIYFLYTLFHFLIVPEWFYICSLKYYLFCLLLYWDSTPSMHVTVIYSFSQLNSHFMNLPWIIHHSTVDGYSDGFQLFAAPNNGVINIFLYLPKSTNVQLARKFQIDFHTHSSIMRFFVVPQPHHTYCQAF